MAICFFDLDDLKKTNDSFGHDVGDEMIQLFGDLLWHHTRSTDILALDLNNYFNGSEEYTELTYRLKRGEEGYLWVRNALNMTRNGNGDKRVYCVYHDMTMEMEEKSS